MKVLEIIVDIIETLVLVVGCLFLGYLVTRSVTMPASEYVEICNMAIDQGYMAVYQWLLNDFRTIFGTIIGATFG